MAGYGLDDSDFDDFLESTSSEDEATPLPAPLPAALPVPAVRLLTATAFREPVQAACGDASRLVPPNRWQSLIYRKKLIESERHVARADFQVLAGIAKDGVGSSVQTCLTWCLSALQMGCGRWLERDSAAQ